MTARVVAASLLLLQRAACVDHSAELLYFTSQSLWWAPYGNVNATCTTKMVFISTDIPRAKDYVWEAGSGAANIWAKSFCEQCSREL